jgi:hypothetical protein
MAKEKELKLAQMYYVVHGKTAKESARLAGVTEKTIGKWIEQYGWKTSRDTEINSKNNQIDNLKQILSLCAEERLELGKQLNDAVKSGDLDLSKALRVQMASIADEVSKWNKALENLNKSSKISLEVYINVAESIWRALQAHDQKLYKDTLDFQEMHIQQKAVEIG